MNMTRPIWKNMKKNQVWEKRNMYIIYVKGNEILLINVINIYVLSSYRCYIQINIST